MKKRILKTLVATCMTAMMFVGCTSNGAANEEIKMGDTVKVTDVRGEVEIPANPQRIVDEKVTDISTKYTLNDFKGEGLIIRRGKKKFAKVVAE